MNNLYKDKLISVLKYFVSICEQNKLTYYLAAGSALGAIRHHDIIPWDDDIDIYMPRLEYEKFLSLKNSYENDNYKVVSLQNEGYYLPFAKMIDVNTTIWERKHFPFVVGVYIDIFPLDRVNMDFANNLIFDYKIKFNKYLRGISWYSCGDLKDMLFKGKILRMMSSVIKMTYYRMMNKKYKNDFINYDKNLNNNRGNCLVVFGGSYGVKEIYKEEWFIDTVEVDFSGIKVKLPIGYHDYLSHLYGNYMKIPPIKEQRSRHKHFFVDYKRRIEIDKILKIKK